MLSGVSTKVTLSIVIGLIITIGACVAVSYLNNQKNVGVEDSSFSPEFEEDQTRNVNEASVSGGIEIPGYSTIVIPSNEEVVAVNFYNPENNKVYFEICLSLGETGEEIYKSKLLAPGQHLYEIELERGLDKGSYEMVITYNTYGMDENYTPKNGATVNCVLTVE